MTSSAAMPCFFNFHFILEQSGSLMQSLSWATRRRVGSDLPPARRKKKEVRRAETEGEKHRG